jgi:hypothetical protein
MRGGFGILHGLQIFLVNFKCFKEGMRKHLGSEQRNHDIRPENLARLTAHNLSAKFVENEPNIGESESQSEVVGVDGFDSRRIRKWNVLRQSRLLC